MQWKMTARLWMKWFCKCFCFVNMLIIMQLTSLCIFDCCNISRECRQYFVNSAIYGCKIEVIFFQFLYFDFWILCVVFLFFGLLLLFGVLLFFTEFNWISNFVNWLAMWSSLFGVNIYIYGGFLELIFQRSIYEY